MSTLRSAVICRPFHGIYFDDGSALVFDNGDQLGFGGHFEPETLRFYALYWDRLDLPISPGDDSSTGGTERPDETDLDFLQAAGVLERTEYLAGSHEDGRASGVRMQQAVFDFRNANDPGNWSIAQTGHSLVSENLGTIEAQALEVQLYSALPMPGPTTSLEEVLEFKARRKDELQRFRLAMDDLYQGVLQAPDQARALSSAASKIEVALRDLNAVFAESFPKRMIGSLKVELNAGSLAGAAILGAEAAGSVGFPLHLGAAVGACASALKFDLPHIRKSQQVPTELRDYAYLYHVNAELD